MSTQIHKMIVVSAPSGAGKTTIVKYLLKTFPQLGFSISATSRKIRAGEIDGREYYFLTTAQFKMMIENNDLLEWQEVYAGNFYGTPVSEVQRINTNGQIPVFDLDVVGGINVKKMYGENVLALFVKPPSVLDLENRLRTRATENEESIQRRLSKAKWELSFENQFDKIILNDNLENAYKQAVSYVSSFLGIS